MPHTPGPWSVIDGEIVGPTGYPVARMYGQLVNESAIDGELETQANLVLIAAVPDLLAAAQAFLLNASTSNRKALRDAITKALGT